ncbi:hypothetical protein NIES267_32490 [Calothrix parasitica NIES-267]|uniref:Uncharacterized protein n=1 Tax=Calothrix parasitica NIES-267 TaxID=1973488 RepID=A0A1Z4LRP1_9CYAN|nr:hypothetical protein NIES267_32490 [Calothrix parasitica NIES-267]
MSKNNLKNKLISNVYKTDNNNSGFVLGIISAILLLTCIGTLLVFNNKRVERITTKNRNIDSGNNSNQTKITNTLLTEKKLNIEAKHLNGTVGKLTNISFQENNTIIRIAVTNGFWHAIHLNLHGKGVILVDGLGNTHNLKPPLDNPSLKIESNTTFQGDLIFQGGITSKANNLTLITNNQIGSDQAFTRRPKMEFSIPINPEDKLIKPKEVEEEEKGENTEKNKNKIFNF